MLSAQSWRADALVRLFGSVLVCVVPLSALAVVVAHLFLEAGSVSMGTVCSLSGAAILLGVALFLLQRRWKAETLVRDVAVVLAAVYSSFFLLWIASRLQGTSVDPKALNSTVRMFIGVFCFQGLALILVHRFLREHQLGWSEAFGFRNGLVPALISGITLGCVALPVLNGLQMLSGFLLHQAGIRPQEQEAVQLLRSSGGMLNRAVLGAAVILVVPFAEEVLFRGIFYRSLRQFGFPRLALWASAIVFGAIHVNLVSFVPLTVFAVALAWLYDKTGNLCAPVAAHLVFNTANFVMLFALDLQRTPLHK